MVLVPLLKIKKPWLKIVNIRNLNKAKLVSNWEQNMLYTKKWQILRRKGISILTDWKMSFLCVYVCVCVLQTRKLYNRGDSMELNFEGLEMQK